MSPEGEQPERDPNLLCEPSEKEALENQNAVDQIDFITYLVDRGLTELRESHVLELHKLCVQNIYPCGGKYRTAHKRVYIQSSEHEIPEPALVPSLVRDAVDWISAHRNERSALECAAYALWRFNWIHPFAGGNGRTSRAISYLIVCAGNGNMIPGEPVMPDLIYDRRDDYITALRAVDASLSGSPEPDCTAMSAFLRDILTRQLASAIDRLSKPPQ